MKSKSTMEAVGAIAPVSQLLFCSFSAIKLLLHLVKGNEAGPIAHQHEVDNIRQLELLIEDVVKTPQGFSVTRENAVIPTLTHVPVTGGSVTGAVLPRTSIKECPGPLLHSEFSQYAHFEYEQSHICQNLEILHPPTHSLSRSINQYTQILMAPPLNLKIDALCDNGRTALDVKLATTLNEFLQPQSEVSIHDAAQSILTHLPADMPYSDEGFAFATLVVEVAVQIPYQHPSHARLVRLLKHLTRSPKLVSRSTKQGEEELCVNFQALGEQLRDNFQGESFAEGEIPRHALSG